MTTNSNNDQWGKNVISIRLFLMVSVFVLTLLTGCAGSNLGFPRISESTDIEIDDDDLVTLLTDYTSWPLPFTTEVQLYSTEDDGEAVEDELDDLLAEKDWDNELDWESFGDEIYSAWEKDDLHVEYLILSEIDDDWVDTLDDEYDIDIEEDSTLILAVGWDYSRPVSLTGLGWGTCDFAESDLTIACLEAIDGVGDENDWLDDVDGVWGVYLLSGWIEEYDAQDGLEYLEEEFGARFDLEEDLEEIFEDFIDNYIGSYFDYDYDEDNLEQVRTEAGPMLLGIIENTENDISFVVGLAVYDEEMLINYSAMLDEDYDIDVQ